MENLKNKNAKNVLVILYICVSLLAFIIMLLITPLREVFKKLSSSSPYIMGFIKFALLATAGELIAEIIKNKTIVVPCKIVWRFLIWGVIGVWITFMMKVFSTAVSTMMATGLLVGKDSTFLKAFFTSLIMNTTFGPTFMAVHKCSDKFLELRAKKENSSLLSVITGIDWHKFVSFTIFKTVPLFWVPMHTVTFLLPQEFQVMMAAGLSVALGVILSFGNKKKKIKETNI
jgi:hypothetical protein